MSMTHEEAARILDPKTTREALNPYADSPAERMRLLDEACRIAADVLRNKPTGEALTIEQLREMDGKPAYWPEDESWGIISVDKTGRWSGIPFFRGRWKGVNFEYDIEARGMEVYAYPPAHIDREEWVSVEERLPEDEKDGETVLVIVFGKPHENITLHGAIMTAGYFRDEGWVLNEYPEWEGPEVTHWMPLPSAPAELEKRLNG